LTLRVLGVRADGYHDLRTTFQSVALHDTLTFTARRGPFQIEADDPACPVDDTNLIWRAADALWREMGRRGSPADLHVRVQKRIPVQAGLGGGSSDAAAALRALSMLWRLDLESDLHAIAAGLGADVPYFLRGGTVLGLERGDLLYQLMDTPASWVVIVLPDVGISTRDAFGWWDQRAGRPDGAAVNDLQAPVTAHHPEIGAVARALERAGARTAAMSGSGAAVFGLFGTAARAQRAARGMASSSRRTWVTRTLTRARFAAASRPLACG
jgi:4-diphosphocytidyl-2-C-methyl-D-erythritol kinase